MKLKHISGISEGLLNEAGLSRILSHAARPFVILTAFRDDFSLKQNRNRNKQLEQKFREINAGGIKLIGYYQEEGTPAPSREESYFVPMPSSMFLMDFVAWTQSVIREFDQDAAIFANYASYSGVLEAFDIEDIRPGVWLLWKDHDEPMTHIGDKITIDKIAQAYSIIKGKSFIFEGTMHPSCNAHRMGLDLRGVQW